MTTTPQTLKQVLIVGGGFGGVKTALELSKQHGIAVTLLSDQTCFRYYPALYHTATGGLYQQSNIPLTEIIDTSRITFVQGTATSLDRTARTVTTEQGDSLHYDILVLALGVVTNYFGIAGLEKFSYSIKSAEQIRAFKQHLHSQLDSNDPDLNYVIVGAGPTGIEVAGALPAYLKKIMHNHGVKNISPKITIIEAAPRLLPHSPEKISSAVAKRLAKLGIEVRLGQVVEGQTAEGLMVSGQPITSKTVIWTAGTANNPFFKQNNFALTERGKVSVNEFLQAEENIYVIGDNANTTFSGLAQTALRDGIFVANDIKRRLQGKNQIAYKPKKPISVIPVGHGWSTVEWGNSSFVGIVGWWLREAADWVGFYDLQPWWKATRQWMTEFGSYEECPTCKK